MLKNNKLIFSIYIFLIVVIGILLSLKTRDSLHLTINSWHTGIFDIIFKYITYLGDGVLIVIVSIALLIYRIRYTLMEITAYLISGILVQVQKRLLFKGWPRPAAYFEDNSVLNFVEGVKIHHFNSFPSGHTASAFAFFFTAIFLAKSNGVKFLFFILALMVGFSRVYLNEHFMVDVYFGSMNGVISAMIAYFFISRSNAAWMNKSILNIKQQ